MKDPLLYDFLKRKLVAYRGLKLKPKDMAYLVGNADLLFDAFNFKYGLLHSTRYVSGLTFTEQFPEAQNRISLSQKGMYKIRWRVSEEDGASLEKFIREFYDNHSSIFEDFMMFPNVDRRLESAGHHSGGCRMADTPNDGVVDSNMKVFGVDNLFVVDGSTLGYSGYANTGLTICALALKCADFIKGV
jgi:choline dehydrogenase-like flavoprotein